jgi:hypothetical protein
VLQLQAIAAAQQRDEPLPIVAALHEPSSGIEDVLWHTTLSFHADLKAEAARKAAAELTRMRANAKKGVDSSELASVSAAAAALVTPPISLHLLRPDELKAGMITQAAVAPQLANVFSELFTQVRCLFLQGRHHLLSETGFSWQHAGIMICLAVESCSPL